jgi:hypothetical protein
VRAAEMKLKLFWEQQENVNPCYFSSCGFLHKDGLVSVPLPRVHTLAVIDTLRYNDFYSHATNICVSVNPFFIEVISVPENDGSAV